MASGESSVDLPMVSAEGGVGRLCPMVSEESVGGVGRLCLVLSEESV